MGLFSQEKPERPEVLPVHVKDGWLRHPNGTRLCACGHPENEHFQWSHACAHGGCRCMRGYYTNAEGEVVPKEARR